MEYTPDGFSADGQLWGNPLYDWDYMKKEGYNWGLMRSLWITAADTTIVQAQDLLSLGSESRMNTPSSVGKNWRWRALPGVFTEELAAKLGHKMELYGRI
ncbi:MAG: 4-alpha-glucanotransferase [Oscillospiraceae bacterium]|nr:4-alpha-glucanotransferase [Oscillospiraceae bacterium]